MSQFTLRQLEYFIACAELGSMRAASEHVHLTQSAISTSIADLEKGLGVQLLIRHTRGLSLTQAGTRVLSDARRLMGAAEDLQTSAREIGQALTGSLRVGCYSTLAPVLLPRAIADFSAAHPEVALDILEGSHTQLEEELRSGGCELALGYDYQLKGSMHTPDLDVRVVRNAPPHVLLPADHRLARRKRVRLAELEEEPYILFDLAPGGDYFLNIFEQAGVQPNIHFRTQSFETARSLVARRLGYTILTQQTTVSKSYEGFGLVRCALADDLLALNIVLMRLAGTEPTRRAEAFAKQCFESLAAES